MTSTSDTTSTAETASRPAVRIARARAGWRFWVAVGVWITIVAAVVLGFQTFWMMVAIGIGHAWGPPTTPADWTEVWARWVGILIGVGCAAIGAMVARRWVALALALVVLVGSGLLASGVADKARPT